MLIRVDHTDLRKTLAETLRNQLASLGYHLTDKEIEIVANNQTQGAMSLDPEPAL